MAIRPTMKHIIDELRHFGNAGLADEFEGVTYWTDGQLQDIADRHGKRGSVKIKVVDPENKVYRLVAPRVGSFETDIKVLNEAGAEVSGGTYSYATAEVSFTTTQTDDTYWIYGFFVDINAALAELWELKAAQRFDYIDWKAQNNRMNMKQEYDHCLDRARYYRSKKIRMFDRKGRGSWFF